MAGLPLLVHPEPVHKFSHVDPLTVNGQHRSIDSSENMEILPTILSRVDWLYWVKIGEMS